MRTVCLGFLILGVACSEAPGNRALPVNTVQPVQSLVALLDNADVHVPKDSLHAQVPPQSPYAGTLLHKDLVKLVPLGKPREGWDARQALWAPAPSRFDWALHLPPKTRLDLALGQLPKEALRDRHGLWPMAPADVRLNVFARLRGESTWTAVASTTAGSTDWQELRVDLSSWGGRDMDLRLATTGARGAAALIGNPVLLSEVTAPSPRPNVLLVVVDTLRAASVGCYGYHGAPTTPVIDSLCAHAAVFDNAIANANWTRPSTLALLTAKSTALSGLPAGSPAFTDEDRAAFHKANPSTLPSSFAQAGYASAGFVNNLFLFPTWSRRLEPSNSGVDAGFPAIYNNERKDGEDARQITRRARAFLRDHKRTPFFAYVHYGNCHNPYGEIDGVTAAMRACPTCDNTRTDEQKRYDGDVAFDDAQIGELLTELQEQQLINDTIVVITADHGEVFDEAHAYRSTRRWPLDTKLREGNARFDHGYSLNLEVHSIPMLIAARGIQAARITTPFSLSDLSTTLIALAGLPPLPGSDGFNAALALRGKQDWPADRVQSSEGSTLRLIRTRRWSYIQREIEASTVTLPDGQPSSRREELYDLDADPLEHHNLIDDSPEALQAMRGHLGKIFYQPAVGYHIAWTGNAAAAWLTGSVAVQGHVRDCGFAVGGVGSELTCGSNGSQIAFKVPANEEAHIVVRTVPEDAPLVTSFALDGMPLPAEQVRLGFLRLPAPQEPIVVSPAEAELMVAATPPAATSGLTLWRAPARTGVAQTLSAPVVDALTAWGYVHK